MARNPGNRPEKLALAGWHAHITIVGLISAAHQALPDGGTSALSGLDKPQNGARRIQNNDAYG